MTNERANLLAKEPVVWYITGEPILIALFLSVVFFLLSIFSKKINIDSIGIFLMFRCFICFIPLLYVTGDLRSFTSHYLVTYYSVFVYLIAYNGAKTNSKISSKFVVFWGLILVVQVLLTFVRINFSYFDLGYKSSMSIPVGSSNGIGAYLAPILFLFLFGVKTEKTVKIIISVLFIVAIILTRSRGGVVCVLVTYIIYQVLIKHKINVFYIILILLCTVSILIFLLEIPEVELFFMGFVASDEAIDANNLSSGRVDLIEFEIARWLKHPLFGNGMIFNDTTTLSGAHNFIVDLLAQGGLVGLLSYVIPLIIVIRVAYKYKNVENIKGWLLLIIALLVYGMFEANMFTYANELLLWTASGIVMSYKRNNVEV